MGKTWLTFFLILIFNLSSLQAAGLRLYSYRDDQNQIIVVGSLDSVPEKYRDKVKQEFIPSFRSKPAPKKVKVIEPQMSAEPDEPATPNKVEVEPEKENKPTIVKPPAEDWSAEITLARRFMQKFKQIQTNNKRIWALAQRVEADNPILLNLHARNLKALEEVSSLKSFNWPLARLWKSKALALHTEMKRVQYNISRTILSDEEGIKSDLLPLIGKIDQYLNQLNQILQRTINSLAKFQTR
jgi:hypothetical protein